MRRGILRGLEMLWACLALSREPGGLIYGLVPQHVVNRIYHIPGIHELRLGVRVRVRVRVRVGVWVWVWVRVWVAHLRWHGGIENPNGCNRGGLSKHHD